MAAFDTALDPDFVTPSNTTDNELFTAANDSMVFVDVANLLDDVIRVWVGITPSGGSVHWKIADFPIPANDSLLGLGPWPISPGAEVTVKTDTANEATFSVTGVETP